MITAAYPPGGHWSARVFTAGESDDVLTVAELNAIARIVPGDEESDALIKSYITAAIAQVEHDTGLALPTQMLAITFDDAAPDGVLAIPRPPTQEIAGISYTDADGNLQQPDPGEVILQLDLASMPARLTWFPNTFIGAPARLAALGLSVKAGWTKDTLPADLKFAVGLLAAHYVTAGRDRVVIGTSVLDMPAGYQEVIDRWRLEVVA